MRILTFDTHVQLSCGDRGLTLGLGLHLLPGLTLCMRVAIVKARLHTCADSSEHWLLANETHVSTKSSCAGSNDC